MEDCFNESCFCVRSKTISSKRCPLAEVGEVLLKVTYAGICGSDSGFWISGGPQTFPIGHEMVGVIEDPNGSKFKKEDRVSLIEYVPCGECLACKSDKRHLCQQGLKLNATRISNFFIEIRVAFCWKTSF